MSVTGLPVAAQSEIDEDDAVQASVIFYSQRYAIERIQKWCAGVHPDSADSIKAARSEWDAAHQPLWKLVPGILKSQLSKDERMGIAVQARLDNDEIEAKLTEASHAEAVHMHPAFTAFVRPCTARGVRTRRQKSTHCR